MNAYDLVGQKIRYHQWANSILIDWLKEQPKEAYRQAVVSSFPTINRLLHHMMDAQTYYWSILRGVEGNYVEELSTDQLFIQQLALDQQLEIWFSDQDPEEVAREISLKRSPFKETYTVATLITHMLNHSTYHRGQLVAMRHQLKLTAPPPTDYYRYFIATKK